MKIFEDLAIPLNTEYIIKFDTVRADPLNGIYRGADAAGFPAADIYQFKMLVKDNALVGKEIRISDFINLPIETGKGTGLDLNTLVLLSY